MKAAAASALLTHGCAPVSLQLLLKRVDDVERERFAMRFALVCQQQRRPPDG